MSEVCWTLLRPTALGGRGVLVIAGDGGIRAVSFEGPRASGVKLRGRAGAIPGRPISERFGEAPGLQDAQAPWGPRVGEGSPRSRRHLDLAVRELEAYFDGKRRRFSVALDPTGTPFQRAVWEASRRIPYGTVATYGSIGRRIGRPRAHRAVGLALGRNPIAIIVPCHRVVGADGRLTGFSAGLELKVSLLRLEGASLVSIDRSAPGKGVPNVDVTAVRVLGSPLRGPRSRR